MSDIGKAIQTFLEKNNLTETLKLFKNETKRFSSPVSLKKHSYQLQKINTIHIDYNNPQVQHKLRQHLQKTDIKILKKVFQRMKRAAQKQRNIIKNNQQNRNTQNTLPITQMKFFKKLMEKENRQYDMHKQQYLNSKTNNPMLQESRHYQNQWDNPNQMGYDVFQLTTSQFGRVCRQVSTLKNSLQTSIKITSFPESYYQIVSQYKQRSNLNIHDKFYSRLPNDVLFDDPLQKTSSKANTQDDQADMYPCEMNQITYGSYDLKVIYNRDKTGFQEDRQITIVINQVLAGRYQIISVLGQAQFSTAIEVKDLTTQKRYCLKIIQNNKDYFDQSIDQIKILKFIKANCNTDQCYLLNLVDYFYHKQHLMILTELLKDTLLDAYTMKREMFANLRTIQIFARQILIALQKLHQLHIAHTDLKPENILIKSYTNRTLKVIDVGSSVFFHDQPTYYVQTRSYRAPEVILGIPYDGKIDIWSFGCIIAQIFTGQVLFQSQSVAGLLALIQGLRGPWPSWMIQKGINTSKYFTNEMLIYEQLIDKSNSEKVRKTGISRIYTPKLTNMKSRIKSDNKNFLDFLSKCLKIDPSARLSATQALNHPFITQTIQE